MESVAPRPTARTRKTTRSRISGDQANTAYTREFFFELGNGDRRLLRDVVAALQKIDDGAFGDCERCGETIADKRLEALPFARHCIDCQRLVEEEERTAAG